MNISIIENSKTKLIINLDKITIIRIGGWRKSCIYFDDIKLDCGRSKLAYELMEELDELRSKQNKGI